MAGQVNVTGTITGAQGTLQIQLPQENLAAPVIEVLNQALASGANTISVPTGATLVIIQPPVGNTILITLKGVTGDTGVPLHKTLASGPINLDSTCASFVLTAASAISALTTITFS